MLLFVTLIPTHIEAARGDYNVVFYDRWANLPTSELMKKGNLYFNNHNKIDSATVCFSIVANRYYENKLDISDMKYCISAMSKLGYLYLYEYYDYSKSFSYLQQALNLSQSNNITNDLPYIYLNFGNLYFTNRKIYKDAKQEQLIIDYYKKAFALSLQQKKYKTLLISFGNLLNYAYYHGNARSIDKEIDIIKRQKFPPNMEIAALYKSLCVAVEASEKNDYATALKYFDLCYEKANSVYDKDRCILMLNYDKIHLYEKMKRRDEVFKLLKQSEALAKEKNIADVLTNVYSDLYTCYSDAGNKALADHYQLLYFRQKDSLENENKLSDVNRLKFLYELKRVNDTVKDISAKRQKQAVMLKCSVSFSIIVLILLIVIIVNYRRLKQNHRQLYLNSLEILAREREERQLRMKYENQNAATKTEEPADDDSKTTKYQNSYLSDEDKKELISRIKYVMETSQEIYEDEFNINQLAELVGYKYRFVSHVINEESGVNFKTMLSEYRIKEACRRINDTAHYGNFTIEAIATGVGFKSRSQFIAMFRRVTGLTPSEYQKQAKTSTDSPK
jgi:AraC-like DNA-binding protein